jgi:hypothetical protein
VALHAGGLDVEVGDAVGELGEGAPVLSGREAAGEEAEIVLAEVIAGERDGVCDAGGHARRESVGSRCGEELIPGEEAAVPDAALREGSDAGDVEVATA